ncbi:MAG: hypothetical protein AB7J28_03330 [Hyphomonadaceae bacterium]
MSRRGLPRRILLAFTALFGAALAAPEAAAQPQNRRQEALARTTIGGTANAARCSSAVTGGDVSDGTIRTCTRALERDRLTRSDELRVLLNRGVAHLRRNEGQLALADFDAILEQDEDLAEAHLNRGAALVMLGQPAPAVAAITTALSLGVREPHKAYYNRGAAREALGDIRGAYDDYSTALEIQPDWGPAEAELLRFVRSRQERLAQLIGAGGLAGASQVETQN